MNKSLLLLAFSFILAPLSRAADPIPPKNITMDVSVVRFKPAKADRILQGFKDLGPNLSTAIERLKADGEVSVLYSANRELRLEDGSKAKFDALETRPVIIIGKAGAPLPPATSYGLTLEVTTKLIDAERFGLSWTGSISWSPEIVDKWKGEKFLSFVSTAADIAKRVGADGKNVNTATDIGLGLAQLFNPQGKPQENEIYELPVNKTVSFISSRNCKSGELIINATTAEMGSKEAQTILLLMLPTVTP